MKIHPRLLTIEGKHVDLQIRNKLTLKKLWAGVFVDAPCSSTNLICRVSRLGASIKGDAL